LSRFALLPSCFPQPHARGFAFSVPHHRSFHHLSVVQTFLLSLEPFESSYSVSNLHSFICSAPVPTFHRNTFSFSISSNGSFLSSKRRFKQRCKTQLLRALYILLTCCDRTASLSTSMQYKHTALVRSTLRNSRRTATTLSLQCIRRLVAICSRSKASARLRWTR
jgi:hypothetical protein